MDGAFFSDTIVSTLDKAGVEYTISVPFEHFAKLKTPIEQRSRWYTLDQQYDYFESKRKPKSWRNRHRLIFVRQQVKVQSKQPVQLDLFIPYEYGYSFKAVLTNKALGAEKAVAFHNGRGNQESVFAELKSRNQLDYVPVRTWQGNQAYLLSTLLTHTLSKELQMIKQAPIRTTQQKRPALWCFEQLGTSLQHIIQRAG